MKWNRFATVSSAVVALSVLATACNSDGSTGVTTRPSQIVDPQGDFVTAFSGPHDADLDALGGEVSFDGTNFTFTAAMAGSIGATSGATYVWGLNRGAGTARFGSLATGVVFDAVVVLNPGGTSAVNDFVTSTSTPLPASSVTVSGASITAIVPATLLPSQGLAPAQYTVNLWPRTSAGISDFAPDNSMAPVRVVP